MKGGIRPLFHYKNINDGVVYFMRSSVGVKAVAGIVFFVAIWVVIGITVFRGLLKEYSYDTKHTPTDSTLVESSASDSSTDAQPSVNAHIIEVTGDTPAENFNTVLYTKRLYELHYLFAVYDFDKVSELSVSQVVQYAFCSLFYDSLVDMPAEDKAMVLRQVIPESISDKLVQLFGENTIDITQSDLYNKDKGLFEMWQPRLRSTVYARTTCKALGKAEYQLTAQFFTSVSTPNAETMSTPHTEITGVFVWQKDSYILKSMHTKTLQN